MQTYKLIVSDFDRTLADQDLNVSDTNKQAIKRWQDAGNLFSIASGRSYLMIKDRCQGIDLKTPIIGRGGAEIVDPKTEETLFEESMSEERVGVLLDVVKRHNLKCVIEIGDKVYSDYYKNLLFPSLTYLPFDKFKLQPVPKIVIFVDEDRREEESRIMEEEVIKKFPDLHAAESVSYRGRNWDITTIGSTKNFAMLKLMQILDIPREEIVGIGDGYNDFPLLETCGFKVVVENGAEDLKAIADLIVPSYQDDGVAYLIDQLLKEN